MLITAVILLIIIVGWGLGLMFYKDQLYHHSDLYERTTENPTKILVVYYSRSGNTEIMARELAKGLDADIAHIEEKSYTLDFEGWNNARKHASSHEETEISPTSIDLQQYELILVGSPIWLFRPAPPLWTFVRNNSFTDKKLVLFNTFNSRFEQEEIDTFYELVKKQGGKLIDHVWIKRGRIIWQKTDNEVIEEVTEIVENKKEVWLETVD